MARKVTAFIPRTQFPPTETQFTPTLHNSASVTQPRQSDSEGATLTWHAGLYRLTFSATVFTFQHTFSPLRDSSLSVNHPRQSTGEGATLTWHAGVASLMRPVTTVYTPNSLTLQFCLFCEIPSKQKCKGTEASYRDTTSSADTGRASQRRAQMAPATTSKEPHPRQHASEGRTSPITSPGLCH